tara:strand:+ start:355 stop:612 length:258 start_codon:yes stop_codon:yes gene_type:complete
MRKITISHARHNGGAIFSIQSDASNYEGFKSDLYTAKGLDIDSDNKVTLVSHGEKELAMGEQELPTGELTIMVTPRSMKAGRNDI